MSPIVCDVTVCVCVCVCVYGTNVPTRVERRHSLKWLRFRFLALISLSLSLSLSRSLALSLYWWFVRCVCTTCRHLWLVVFKARTWHFERNGEFLSSLFLAIPYPLFPFFIPTLYVCSKAASLVLALSHLCSVYFILTFIYLSLSCYFAFTLYLFTLLFSQSPKFCFF